VQNRKRFFFEKGEIFIIYASGTTGTRKVAKVFWFFFSKKNILAFFFSS